MFSAGTLKVWEMPLLMTQRGSAPSASASWKYSKAPIPANHLALAVQQDNCSRFSSLTKQDTQPWSDRCSAVCLFSRGSRALRTESYWNYYMFQYDSQCCALLPLVNRQTADQLTNQGWAVSIEGGGRRIAILSSVEKLQNWLQGYFGLSGQS